MRITSSRLRRPAAGLFALACAHASAALANVAPVVTSTPPPVADVGHVYVYDVRARDADGDTLRYTMQQAPEGMTLDPASGALRWSPTSSQTGVQNIEVRIEDGAGASVAHRFALRVREDFCPLYPIALPASVIAPLQPGARVTQLERGTGAGNFSWLSWSGAVDAPTLAQSLRPPGDSDSYVGPTDPSDRLLQIGDFAQGASGSMNASEIRARLDALLGRDIVLPVWDQTRSRGAGFDYRVQRFATVRLNGYDLTGHGWLGFEYRGEAFCYDDPPRAIGQTLQTAEDTPLELVLSGNDPDGDALTYQIVTAPKFGALVGTAAAYTYRPQADKHGRDFFTFRVSDGRTWSAPAEVAIEVTPVNDAPTAQDGSVATQEDQAIDLVLQADDVEQTALRWELIEAPAHGELSGTAAARRYQPAADYHGPDRLRFRVSDGELDSRTAIVTITVAPVNDAPAAASQRLATDEDTPVDVTLGGSDPENDLLEFTLATVPAHGTLRGTAPDLTYVPQPDFHGVDRFTFVAHDGAVASSPATVEIEVRPIDDAPRAQDAIHETDEDAALALTLAGSDAEDQALSFHVRELPLHGRLSGNAPDLFYTPDADYHGPDRFTFISRDASQDSAPATVSILVRPVNDAPTADDLALQTDANRALPVRLSGRDPDGDALSYVLRGQPQHGSLSGQAPDLIYTPAAGFHGADAFTFVVSDGRLESALATASITVHATNAAPRADALQLSGAHGQPLAVTLSGSDPNGDAITFALRNSPAHGTLSGQAPALTYTPTAGFHGEDRFSYIARDAELDSDPAEVTITIAPPNLPPEIISAAPAAVEEGQSYRYTVAAQDQPGDVLSFALEQAPAAMAIDAAGGQLEWPADPALVGGVETPNVMCRRPTLARTFDPVVKWHWRRPAGTTGRHDVFGPVTVAQMTDDNADGRIDDADTPDAVFVSDAAAGNFLNIVSGADGSTITSVPVSFAATGSLALGDLDDDGVPEIVGITGNRGHVQVRRRDGSVLWSAVTGPLSSSASRDAPLIADLDADGSPEVINGNRVFSATGTLRWVGDKDRGGSINYALIPIAVDIDGDGKQELVAGRTAYRHDKTVMWHATPRYAGDGYTAFGNFDADDRPEFALVNGGSLALIDDNGSVKWEIRRLPTTGVGGPPTVADFDGDGRADIGVATADRYVVVNGQGQVLWQRVIEDYSSNQTGSSVFDFDHDGRAEAVYADEYRLYVFDGATGTIRLQTPVGSGTTLEYPTIVDIDGDGSAEIVLGGNRSKYHRETDIVLPGVIAFGSASRNWAPTRKIWNQHAYHVDNVLDDGGIPARPAKSWLTHNSFRRNVFPDRHPLGQPDLAVFGLKLIEDGAVRRFQMRVRNRGQAPIGGDVQLQLATGATPGASSVIASTRVPRLGFNDYRDIVVDVPAGTALGPYVTATADGDGAIAECIEDNNAMTVRLAAARVTDQGGLSDTQWFSVGVTDRNEAPSLHTSTLPRGSAEAPYAVALQASDPDRGDALAYRLVQKPAGMQIDAVTGALSWQPLTSQAGTHGVTVEVQDLGGLKDSRSFSVQIAPNWAPDFTTEPPTEAVLGQRYTYQARAVDPEGHRFTFDRVTGPEGLDIDDATGLVSWTPVAGQVGTHVVEIQVEDELAARNVQRYQIVVTDPGNRAPSINSTPVKTANVGALWSYTVVASDPDGDAVATTLTQAPAGMQLDEATGQIDWTPAEAQLGDHPVSLRVDDYRGGHAIQSFTLTVAAAPASNQPPSITSTPVQQVQVGTEWSYVLIAADPDDDPLSLALTESPLGMSLSGNTLTWRPEAGQIGSHPVALLVSDGRGGSATQRFDLQVSAPPDTNRAPVIESTPTTSVTAGQRWSYAAYASDADGDVLVYELVDAPEGMTLAERLLDWTPTAAQTGTHPFGLRVSDGRGGRAEQSIWLVVAAAADGNLPPRFDSAPLQAAKAGRAYAYAAQTTDPDGDTLQFSLTRAPQGMTVDAAGRVAWLPTTAGNAEVSLRVDDGQAYVEQHWSIVVVAADIPLSATVLVAPQPAEPGQPITITIDVGGAGGAVSATATLDGTPITVVPEGITTLPAPTTPGEHPLVVRVSDGVDTIEITQAVLVADPTDTVAPEVSLLTPDFDAEVTAPIAVTGAVTGSDVARWTLSYRDLDSGALETLAEGTGAAPAGTLGQFDPTRLLNGQYHIVLQAWDASGNHASDTRPVRVTGDLKLGHYAITFEDVSIPLAGIPIQVTRTYDTRRRKQSLDFGHGWTVDASNIRVHESRRVGFSWSLNEYSQGLFSEWCVQPNGDPIVTVTLPDGEVMSFRARAEPECQFPAPRVDVAIVFEPIDGTDGTLSSSDVSNVRLVGSNLVDLSDAQQPPVDLSNYRLTTTEGIVYELNQSTGLKKVSEPDGKFVTYSRDGVRHSSGIGVDFIRDPAGRITEIHRPDGEILRYHYEDGDLVARFDAEDESATFGYHPRMPHYLETIEDARSILVSRNEYDEVTGRLTATVDGEGRRIEFSHDVGARVSRVKDRRGHTTTYTYDDSGRVLSETNALDETIRHTYDDDGNELTRTDPLERTTTWTYDSRGNVLTETNHADETTTSTFNGKNQLLTQHDPAQRLVLDNRYSSTGLDLLETKDALLNPTTFVYDRGIGTTNTGHVASITDAEGALTTMEYNPFTGFQGRETDALLHLTTMQHDDMGRRTHETRRRTRADGSVQLLTTVHDYDDEGRLESTTHPDGSVTTLTYEGLDQPRFECDALQRCVEQVYNARGEVTDTRYPDGTSESKSYDPNGNVLTQTDRAGRTTRFVYDAANRLTVTIHPDETPGNDEDNPRSRNVYVGGQLERSIDERGHVTRYEYDAAGRRTHVHLPVLVDGETAVQVEGYDSSGRRTSSTDALNRRTEYVYDAAGRLREIVHPDSTASLADNPRTRYEYDRVGRKTVETDEMGRTTRYAYDRLGRLVAVVLPNPETGANPPLVDGVSPDSGTLTTRYGYDEVGNKTSQTDAEDRTTRWEYDAIGRETARVLPEGQRETRLYNDAGELESHTDFNGRTTQYRYDAAGRLDVVDYPSDPDVDYGYNGAGERTTVLDGRGSSTREYDARGRVRYATDADGGRIEYQYDDAGNLRARISPSQSLVYEYDERNRLKFVVRTVDGEAPITTRYEYYKDGSRKAMVGGDGIRTEYTYDVRNRLRDLVKKTAAGAVMLSMAYTVDASGMRSNVVERDAAGIVRSVTWGYDKVRRLTSEAIDHRTAAQDRSTTWTYDKVGNRRTQTLVSGGVTETTTYTYDDNDRLATESRVGGSAAGTTTYAYDDNGNTTGKTGPGGATIYRYDDANRLNGATTPEGEVAYVYDADGLRVRQTFTPNGGAATTTWYVQDTVYPYAQVVEEYTSQGSGAKQLAATFTFADELVSQTRYANGTPTTRFIQFDGFGSTRWLTDATGSITDKVDHDAFGEQISHSGPTEVEHLYRGEAFDPNVGFYYLRARWYGPESGRFLTQDTFAGFMRTPVSLHKYLYANVDPVNVVDPAGKFGFLSVSVGGLSQASFRGFSAGGAGSFVAKTGAEIAFEIATGIPVITSPRSLIGALRNGANVTGKLATKFWLNMFKGGSDFEMEALKFLSKLGYTKNKKRFANGKISDERSGYFIPDVYVKGDKLLDFKTSFGAVSKEQFQQFIMIANQELGLKVSLVMLKKPTAGEVAIMEKWAKEVSTKSDEKDILFSVIHLLD